MAIFIKGFFLGLSLAAIVGPISILCIQRTLRFGRLYGFISGLGAATADAFYTSLAAFGLVLITTTLIDNKTWIQAVGGIILLYLGCRIIFAKADVKQTADDSPKSFASAYGTTFVLTITNPLTILSYIAIFAGLGVTTGTGYISASLFVAAIFLGSTLWWFLLSSITAFGKNKLQTTHVTLINKVAGLIIIGFGVFSLMSIW